MKKTLADIFNIYKINSSLGSINLSLFALLVVILIPVILGTGCATEPTASDKPTIIDITDVYESTGTHLYRKELSNGKTTLVYRLYQQETLLDRKGVWLITYRDDKLDNAFLKKKGENQDQRIDWDLKSQKPEVKIIAHKKIVAKQVVGKYMQNYLAYFKKEIDYECDGTINAVHYFKYNVGLYGKSGNTPNKSAFNIPIVKETVDWGNDNSIDIVIKYQYSSELGRVLKKETSIKESLAEYKDEIKRLTKETPTDLTEYFKYDENGNLIEETIDRNNNGIIDLKRETVWKNLDITYENDGWMVETVNEDLDADGKIDIITRYKYIVLDFPVKRPSQKKIKELASKY